jgi:hypothetical protein
MRVASKPASVSKTPADEAQGLGFLVTRACELIGEASGQWGTLLARLVGNWEPTQQGGQGHVNNYLGVTSL